ncbi:hypothetical protein [Streptomyces sp. GbtcB7]|uniref:hypothetical protein n=1 Tax=Streptomyces sp. GbtcB7 TaxID=2824752 RepID=UPI001C3086F4|nr:hypothetical protein [Streptomyces sp. GbtcB7]
MAALLQSLVGVGAHSGQQRRVPAQRPGDFAAGGGRESDVFRTARAQLSAYT